MDSNTQAVLDKIVAKDLSEITEADEQFLRARSSYLDKNAQKKFAAILKDQPKAEVKEEEQTTEDPQEQVEDDGEEEQAAG